MESALLLHRLQFAFTASFHYLFPQLTMGLALLIVVLKTFALRTKNERYNRAAAFWARIFAINFAVGVVTGIPMEFQFGTNWSRFSRNAGGVIGQTLAMEGVFSFFLESSFLGLFIFGEKRLSPIAHWWTAFLVFLGSWLSGYFIIVTNAFMQHPVGQLATPDGSLTLGSAAALLTNPWAFWQYLHNMTGSVVTGSAVMASIGAFYLLSGQHLEYGRIFVRVGVIAGVIASVLMLYPTGDSQGKMIAWYQPVTLAAMEGVFETQRGAPITIIGQPDPERNRIDNPLQIPKMLSFLTYRRWTAEVKGLNAYPKDVWPDNIPLLFYSFHVMIGLGTIFIGLFGVCAYALWRGVLLTSRPLLWALMLLLPFPYIANTAGWITAEVGRQPWLVYGVMRTQHGDSHHISAGNALFTLIGFMGMYMLLGILFLFLVYREIDHGPEPQVTA
jgi:cytochrome d ubiquinol oxidase subunit I